jgi:hypothetical protein
MGNQPSAPPPPPPPPAPAPPPLPPPCDLDCQKQKQLAVLKTALDTATDPIEKEKARIAYYTLLNGQGWLATEKTRIAKEDVEPVLVSYSNNFNTLKAEQQSNSTIKKLAGELTAKSKADAETTNFLDKEFNENKDRANVLDRLNQLNTGGGSYIPIIMDIVLSLLGIFVVYSLVKRFYKSAPAVVPTGTFT